MQASPSKQTTRFDPKAYEREGLTEEAIIDIKTAFDLFDEDKGGTIDPKELKDAILGMGVNMQSETVFEMIDNMDADGSGQIDFQEFLDLMTASSDHKDTREDLKKVFALFEDDGKGFISYESLAKKVKTFEGTAGDEQEMREMIERADTDNDGRVTEDDFYNIMTNQAYR